MKFEKAKRIGDLIINSVNDRKTVKINGITIFYPDARDTYDNIEIVKKECEILDKTYYSLMACIGIKIVIFLSLEEIKSVETWTGKMEDNFDTYNF